MLRYAQSVPSQQTVLAPLQALISQVPACEIFITFAGQVGDNMPSLSAGALQNVAKITRNMAKVFDYLHDTRTMSIPSSQYLLNLSRTAQVISVNSAMAAIVADGGMNVAINVAAQNALNTLDAWDAVQGYQTPSYPDQLANTLMGGVSF